MGRLACRNGNLEAVLAGVPAARHLALDALDQQCGRRHERQLRGFRRPASQHAGRRWTLQRHQRQIGSHLKAHIAVVAAVDRPQHGQVGLGAHRIDHDAQPIGMTRHDQVVEHTACRSREQRVAHASRHEAGDGTRHAAFQPGRHVAYLIVAPRVQLDDAHVADVEQSRRRAGSAVLGNGAVAVAHGQRMAAEVDHPAAEFGVQVEQRGAYAAVGVSHQPVRLGLSRPAARRCDPSDVRRWHGCRAPPRDAA